MSDSKIETLWRIKIFFGCFPWEIIRYNSGNCAQPMIFPWKFQNSDPWNKIFLVFRSSPPPTTTTTSTRTIPASSRQLCTRTCFISLRVVTERKFSCSFRENPLPPLLSFVRPSLKPNLGWYSYDSWFISLPLRHGSRRCGDRSPCSPFAPRIRHCPHFPIKQIFFFFYRLWTNLVSIRNWCLISSRILEWTNPKSFCSGALPEVSEWNYSRDGSDWGRLHNWVRGRTKEKGFHQKNLRRKSLFRNSLF